MAEAAKILIPVLTFIVSLMSFTAVERYSAKKTAASFTFWSQIRLRLLRINNYLSYDVTLINNLFLDRNTIDWFGNPPSDEKLNVFYNLIEECMQYLTSASDQLPAYVGWSEDMKVVHGFLSDCITFDIRDSKDKFISDSNLEQCVRDNYQDQVCSAIQNIIAGIDWEQKEIEMKICRYYSRKNDI